MKRFLLCCAIVVFVSCGCKDGNCETKRKSSEKETTCKRCKGNTPCPN